MSEDSFLTRWSRRKAAAQAEPLPDPARGEAKQAESDVQPQAAPEPAADEVDLSALPPLDSISSVTDITGFLKRGVPEALRTAALRKAWTSDPAIRDFIGPSENAWDFNDPAGIPGFGPIDMPAEQVRQMAAELVGEVRKAAEKIGDALAQTEAQEIENAQTAEAENPNLPAVHTATQQSHLPGVQQNPPSAVDAPLRPRSHGSALPR